VLKRIVWLFVLLILAGGVVAGLLYVRVNKPYRGYATPDQFIEIPQARGAARSAIGWSPPV
jgi:hypothetical protein